MPPPFVPANSHPSVAASESVKFTPQYFNGQHPMHNAHPSASSVMFGGYPESNNSSPAPPLSAGNAPPYPYPQQQHYAGGRHGPHQSNGGHSQHMSNGYSPMGPPPPPGYYPRQDGFMSQGTGNDNYARRQMISFGPPDGYSPSTTPFGGENQRLASYDPSTPHSFHGSQSSAPNDQDNGSPFYAQYPTAVISNGSNGHIDEVRLYQQPRPKPRTGSQPLIHNTSNFPNLTIAPNPPTTDHLDGLLMYLQNQFGDSTFADYTLELRYSDDRAEPVRIPGHNLLFARSPKLKAIMTAQAQESNSDGLTVRTLLIESDDRFLRSDAFWMAVQRLYGGPLLDLGLANMTLLPISAPSTMPGTPADRFDLALGYAAAGHLLQIPPVVNRGSEVAGHFVGWETAEKALDFALDGGLDSHWTHENRDRAPCPSTYGPAVNMIIFSTMNFIVQNFPAQLELDTSVKEPPRNRRLPRIEEHLPPPQNPLLSKIQFGEYEEEKSENPVVTLSKILLNLPFHLLKYVLESPRLGNVQLWASTELRSKVMHRVIEEREKRRNKVRDNTHISNAERLANAKEWDAVGWQESVAAVGGHDAAPTVTRTWVEFTIPGN